MRISPSRVGCGLASLILGLLAQHSTADVVAVLRLSPVGPDCFVAATLKFEPGRGLSGLRFYNNDQGAPFPRLILMEGEANQSPDLADAALVLLEITGESLAWPSLPTRVRQFSPGSLV